MSAGADTPRPSAIAFAWSQALGFARTHLTLIAAFAGTSLLRIAGTIATILLIRDFLTGVLETPSGLTEQLIRNRRRSG